MTRILFICHGNICRSPTAEFIMKDLVHKAGLDDEFEIASAATSSEEIGSPVYPPAKRLLKAHGIDCSEKRARRMAKGDYTYYDLIISMDRENRLMLLSFYEDDPQNKIRNLLDYAGHPGVEIADPWYTRDFDKAWNDIYTGCEALLKELSPPSVTELDFSHCRSKEELYDVMRREMNWREWYGGNLDALWDILTALPHSGEKFSIILPRGDADESVINYAKKIAVLFDEAGVLDKNL